MSALLHALKQRVRRLPWLRQPWLLPLVLAVVAYPQTTHAQVLYGSVTGHGQARLALRSALLLLIG